ncbi:hypothetical protein CPC08DRAFT_816937 [Agrocybe pediades]|nr:hypothetical protein CPC08DRAFT_816937 [Agrocybe pediades]
MPSSSSSKVIQIIDGSADNFQYMGTWSNVSLSQSYGERTFTSSSDQNNTSSFSVQFEDKTIFVDNEDFDIHYSAGWARNTDDSNSNTPGVNAIPLGNSTHRCSLPGSTFSYQNFNLRVRFFGASLVGSLTTSFTIDDGPPVNVTHIVDENSSGFLDEIGGIYNYPIFTQDGLSAKQHTLSGYISPSGAQTFVLDYMSYTALSKTTITNLPPGSSSQRHISKGALIGGIVGGATFVLILIFCFVWTRRRRQATQIQIPKPSTASDDEAFLDSLQTTSSPLRPVFAQENSTLTPFYDDSIRKVAPTTPLDAFRLQEKDSENTTEDLARDDRLLNFDPSPPSPVLAASTQQTRAESQYDRRGDLISSRSNAAGASVRPLPDVPSSYSASIVYPTPSRSHAPPSYDCLSTRTASTRRPPTYRGTRISDLQGDENQ